MASFNGILVFFLMFRVLIVDSMLNFQYLACVNPWENKEFFTTIAYYPGIREDCFKLCENDRFVFARGFQCSCANNLNSQTKLNDTYCHNGLTSLIGWNLGSALYCNKNDINACEVLLTESRDPYPSFDEDTVDCLGGMCGVLQNPDDAPSSIFPGPNHPLDCIRYCAYEKKSYAHYGNQMVQYMNGNEVPLPFCSCRDSATVTEASTNCRDSPNYDVTSLWSIYCTTKHFPENSSCLAIDQFPEENFGNKEEICRSEQPVTFTTTVETITSTIATTTHSTTATEISTTTLGTTTEGSKSTSSPTTTTTAISIPGPGEICYCSRNDSYYQLWNVKSGTTELKDCPLNQAGKSSWTCESLPEGNCNFTTKQPNFSECHSQWLGDLIVEGNDTSSILQKLESETNITNNYYGHEIEDIVDTLQVVLELERKQLESNSSEPKEVLSRAINATKRGTSVLNNLIIHENPWDQIEENRTGVATKILNGSEAVGLWLSDISRSVNKSLNCEIEFPGILLGSIRWDLELQDLLDCDLQVLDNNTLTKEVQFPSLISRDSRITLLWSSNSTARIYNAVGVIYTSTIIAESFPGHKNTFGESKRDKHINSPVLSYVVVGESVKDLKVNLVFRHQEEAKNPPVKNLRRNRREGEKPSPVISSSICSFINFNPGNGEDWTWDNEGCVVKRTNRTHTVCECNHLTSFASLMDIHNYTGPDAGLELTSMTCSSLSAISLFFTIVLLSSLRQIRNDRTAITQNLCLCLMIFHLLVMNVFDRNTYDLSDEVCAAFGIVLHYTLLASFTWMAVEGLRLCQVIVDTFRTGSSKTVIFYCIGYGVPFVIVLVTVIVAATSTEGVTGAYAQEETCWLEVDDFIWSFSGPIAAILLLNLLCLVFAVITSSRLEVNKRRKLNQQFRSTASMTLSLSVLLGLTWILGYFIFSETPVFAYLFTIVNGLQGVLIFVFRCVFNEPVRMAVRRMTKQTKQSLTLRMQLHNFNRNKSKMSKTESKLTRPQREGRPPFTGAQINEILTRKTNESRTSGVYRHGTSITSLDSALSSMGRKDSIFPDEVSIRSDDHLDYHRYSFDSYSDNYY